MKATLRGSGKLVTIEDCYIVIPGALTILLNVLPEISEGKGAAYNDEPVIGRSFPLKTFSHSENRVISMTLHFHVVSPTDIDLNLKYLNAIRSAVYPRESKGGAPFIPPPICQIKCGRLLGDTPVCAVLKNYNVRFPTEVPWDTIMNTYLPYKFSVDTSWDVVYETSQLPGQERIFKSGY